MTEAKKDVITNLGMIGALLIVLLHIKPETDIYWQNIIVDFIYNKSGITSVAVPLFFGISGYLLVGHLNEKNWWRDALVKRIKSLIIPFFIWTYILLTVKFVLYCTSSFLEINLVTPNPMPNGIDWLIMECLGLDLWHLAGIVWYLRSLFFFVLLSPLLVWPIKKGLMPMTFLFLLLILINRYGPYSPTGIWILDSFLANGLSCGGLLFFAIGILLRIRSFSMTIPNFIWGGGGLWLITLLINYFVAGFFMNLLMLAANVVILYLIASRIHLCKSINGFSMPLYLLHIMVSWSIAFVLECFGCYNLYHSFVFWPFKYLIIIVLSLVLANKIKNYHFAKYLFGGRV